MNNLKTGILLIGLSALLVWLGALLGGSGGAQIAFVFALLMNAGAYWWSDRVVLRMYGAHEVSQADAPELHRIVANLAQAAHIPMPRLYIIPSSGLNAFATGRNPAHGAVAVTEGLLQSLDSRELSGVIAHELSHVRHRDILISTVAATLVGAISMIANWIQWAAIFGGFRSNDEGGGGNLIVALLVSMVSAVAASLLQLAISRSREFEADAGAVRLMGDAKPLISALHKLEYAAEHRPMAANPASAHMFIVNPLRGGGITRLFSTHPPIEERVRRLEDLEWRRAF